MSDGAVFQPTIDTLSINAIPVVSGRASGTSITMTRTRQNITKDVGIDGLGYYTQANDDSCTITLVLQPNAPLNDTLDTLLKASLSTPGGIRYSIELTRGRTKYAGLGMISGPPDTHEWSDTTMPTTWTIECTRMVGVTGGHSPNPQ